MPNLTVTVTRDDGVEVGASANITDAAVAGLVALLTDLTHATTGVSGVNPDAPTPEEASP